MKIKGMHRHILVTVLAISLCMPFTISSYATSYSFEKYGDSSNQTWNGTNKVYADGIYVGEMGQIDAFMDNDYNTYKGTNIIDTTASSYAGMDEHSEYTGTLEVNANDLLNGKVNVNDATVNAVTTVNVSDVLDNDINAGVSFKDSTFNKDVTFNGNAPISLDGATVNNLSIGNTQQAADVVTNTANTVSRLDTLLSKFDTLTDIQRRIYAFIAYPYIETQANISWNVNGKTVSFTGLLLGKRASDDENMYGGLGSFVRSIMYIQFLNGVMLYDNFSNSRVSDTADVIKITYNPFYINYILRARTYYTYSYDSASDTISRSSATKYTNFAGTITSLYNSFLSYINANIAYLADTWYRWISPRITPASNYFWYAYNSETGQYDQTNLAGLMQYITWYLGMIYNDSTNVTQQMHKMTQDINTAATTFHDLNTKEQTAIDQIKTGFNNFLPDNNIFQSFKAITWCSNYLQQIYISLGSYGTVVLIGLLFGVCLQFIGYFRYK